MQRCSFSSFSPTACIPKSITNANGRERDAYAGERLGKLLRIAETGNVNSLFSMGIKENGHGV